MANSLSKVEVPVLERVALAMLAENRGETENITLVRIIREAVRRELAREAKPTPRPAEMEART